MTAPLNRSVSVSFGALVASAGTLLCCVLPAVMVALGAGATLASLVSAWPQLIWLSEHKPLVFGVAGIGLVLAGTSLWRTRQLACPIEPTLARSCRRLRRLSAALYASACAAFAIGGLFAFVLPAIGGR